MNCSDPAILFRSKLDSAESPSDFTAADPLRPRGPCQLRCAMASPCGHADFRLDARRPETLAERVHHGQGPLLLRPFRRTGRVSWRRSVTPAGHVRAERLVMPGRRAQFFRRRSSTSRSWYPVLSIGSHRPSGNHTFDENAGNSESPESEVSESAIDAGMYRGEWPCGDDSPRASPSTFNCRVGQR